MAQDTLLGFSAHTLPYRRGEFTTLSTVSLYRICAKKCGSRRPRFRFFAYPNAASGRGRTEHFPRIYFARNWKTSHSFFCYSFYKR